MFGGNVNEKGQYNPLGTSYLWVEEKYNPKATGGEIIKDIFFSDLFAYVYRLTEDPEYLNWAKRSFRDAIFYYGAPGGYIKPSYRSRISFIDEKYPNTRTKIHGWLGRTGHVFLNTLWMTGTK